MDELVSAVRRALGEAARAEFERRVDEQAAFLREELRAGNLDSPEFAIGLELEVYAVDGEGRLARLPDGAFEGCEKELGLHNAEIQTDPDVFDAEGVCAQADAVRERVGTARRSFERVDRELVLDAMWTVPPTEGSHAYLTDVREAEGVTVAANMHQAPRYCAIDNHVLAGAGGRIPLDVPGASHAFPSILFESLATSIQPHLQVPRTAEFPAYYNAAVRTLGPVLALATNSPFLPADLYDGVDDPRALVERSPHELRIAVFEQSINAGFDRDKVRFPRDIDRAADIVEYIVADPVCAPFLREWVDDEADQRRDGATGAYRDRFWEFDHKRGTYWRWVRAVVGGDPVGRGGERSLRIEYRPLPTQPSVDDIVGLQCLVGGLLRGLVVSDHPLATLEWEAARECFYDAAERGPDADLAWVTADGERTSDADVVYDELFALARRGLREQGVPDGEADRLLAPVERRRERDVTPSTWKKARVRERLDDGADLGTAIAEMQREYVRRSRRGEPFVAWA